MAKPRKRATATIATMLRMREELRRRIEREAKKNERSLNTEMVMRLEASFAKDDEVLNANRVLNAVLANSDTSDKWRSVIMKGWLDQATPKADQADENDGDQAPATNGDDK